MARQSLTGSTGTSIRRAIYHENDVRITFMNVGRAQVRLLHLHAEPSSANYGSTHAWAEVFLPGAGWKGFDPTIGAIVGTDHFAVAVARLPESVPPIAGYFVGPPGASLDVGV